MTVRGEHGILRKGLAEDYFAGVLEGDEKVAFEDHLVRCSVCRERLAEVRALDARLREELKALTAR